MTDILSLRLIGDAKAKKSKLEKLAKKNKFVKKNKKGNVNAYLNHLIDNL